MTLFSVTRFPAVSRTAPGYADPQTSLPVFPYESGQLPPEESVIWLPFDKIHLADRVDAFYRLDVSSRYISSR